MHSSDPKDVTITESRQERMRRQVVTWRGSLRGLSVGLLGGMMESMASSRVSTEALPSFLSTDHPWRKGLGQDWARTWKKLKYFQAQIM